MHRFSHVAVTLPSNDLEGVAREDLLRFYGEVLGWTEHPGFAIPGQRIFLRAPNETQYITLRAADSPMETSGYEHLGIAAESEAELRAIHKRAAALASVFPDLELAPIESKYGGKLLTFRLRFRLPLALELQYIRPV